jgi:hypothetical protein
LIVLSSDPDTTLVPSGENATDLIQPLCAFVFLLNSPSASADKPAGVSFGHGGDFEGSGAPESQTWMVVSFDPDTILVPSGENATELMFPL